MSEYKLYCVGESGNCYKVALMLNVCGCDWQPVFVDYFGGETRGEQYRDSLNELGEVPVLEHARPAADPERRDPHLAGRPPRPLRRPRRARAAGSPALDAVRQPQVHQLLRDPALPERHPEERRSRRAGIPARPRARRLRHRRQASGDSAASCSARSRRSPTSRWSATSTTTRRAAIDRNAFPNLRAWTRRIAQLPGWKHPYELMPRGSPSR